VGVVVPSPPQLSEAIAVNRTAHAHTRHDDRDDERDHDRDHDRDDDREADREDEREVMKSFSMNEGAGPWHIRGVRRRALTEAPARFGASGSRAAKRRGTTRGGFAVALVVMAGLAACAQSQPQSCPQDLPASCPSPAPTFSADVAPLIQNHCAGCHSADGGYPNRLLVSYDTITSSMGMTAILIYRQLADCRMPPKEQPPLTSEQRQTIAGWIICGAKND